ncbi:MAG: hypothetical protein KME35_03830 [Aphanocapsa sp. GSE-SYN-MK-11-07L]|jgi:hypothetical protein|nr:hypothetical protein [Aphanocapsa sp. GSE-SYN-MK-11-07L]
MTDIVATDKHRISGYISEEYRRAIEALSESRDCSVSSLIEQAIKNLVDENILLIELDQDLLEWIKTEAKRGFRSPEDHIRLLITEAKEKG